MMSRTARGFTLVEMVVAMALMALVALAIFESFRFAQRSYAKVSVGESNLSELESVQNSLRALLESAYPYSRESTDAAPRNFEGRKDALEFTGPMNRGAGAGFARYSITARPQNSGKGLEIVARWWTDRNGRPSPQGLPTSEEILLSNVAEIEWNYLDSALTGPTGVFQGGNEAWLDEWRERDRLPAAVRVRIKYFSEDARSWPDLIVNPRITDDANCEFDVVAQDCRRVF